VGGQSGQISKITRAKHTGGVVQVVEYLLCKHEALSSNPDPTTTTKTPSIMEEEATSTFLPIIFLEEHCLRCI
jgi:hypothetical protein